MARASGARRSEEEDAHLWKLRESCLDAGAHLGPIQMAVATAEWRNGDRMDAEPPHLLHESRQAGLDVLQP